MVSLFEKTVVIERGQEKRVMRQKTDLYLEELELHRESERA